MSIKTITNLDQFFSNKFSIFSDPSTFIMDDMEFKNFIDSLESGKSYVATFELIISWIFHEEDSPVITLCKPIVITKQSNPALISKFILEQVSTAFTNYCIENDVLNTIGEPDGPGIIVKYNEINLF